MVLQFNEKIVLTENILQSSSSNLRPSNVTLEQTLQNMSTKATTSCDDSFAMALQQLPIHTRLVVVALKKRKAREFDEVFVANIVFRKQREVVVHLATCFCFAT